MAISGYAVGKTSLLNQVGLPFSLITASNLNLESKTTFDSGAIAHIYANTLTITAGYPTVLDLMSLTDPLGAVFAFTTVKHIHLRNKGAGSVTVGGGSNPLFAVLPAIHDDGVLLLTNDFDVEDGVSDTLRITCNSYTSELEIILAGD